jgi:hypothetical protein
MPLVTRFHLLIFAVTLSITAVAVFRIPADFIFPAHWHGSLADWLWPRNEALTVAPVLQAILMAAFLVLGKALTANHLAKTRHIFDPALTLLLAVPAAFQFALLFMGIGSDLDLFRAVAFGLAATLAILSVVLWHAERHSYGGLRMPWPIPADRAWLFVHRATGILSLIAGGLLAWLSWVDAGAGPLVIASAASLLLLPVFAAIFTAASRALR